MCAWQNSEIKNLQYLACLKYNLFPATFAVQKKLWTRF